MKGNIHGAARCFVLASPRSGTTWLKQILNSHPEVMCEEDRLFGRYFDVVKDESSEDSRLRITLDRYLEAFSEHHLHRLAGVTRADNASILLRSIADTVSCVALNDSGKRVYVDKITPYPGTVDIVTESIERAFPEAKIVFLCRDGRDVATSGVFHWLTKASETSNCESAFRKERRRAVDDPGSSTGLNRFFTVDELCEWASLWRDVARGYERLRMKHDTHVLTYELMTDGFASSISELFGFLGVANDHITVEQCREASTFEIMSGGRSRGSEIPTAHVRKGVVGDWRSYFTQDDGECFARTAGDELVRFGYESEDGWWTRLPSAPGFVAKERIESGIRDAALLQGAEV